jgi:integrase/recombinase XerD
MNIQALAIVEATELPEKPVNKILAFETTKSGILAKIAGNLDLQVRKHHLGYQELCDIFERVRNLRRPKRKVSLPHLLTADDLRTLFSVIGNTEHEIMMRFLLFTAIRVNELVHVRMHDVDLENCKVRIERGKGDKDRYVLFPASMQLLLKTYRQSHPTNEYLFESRRFNKYTPRRIQQIMREYGERAGIKGRVHPHLFRHIQLTELTRQGLSDAQIQLISGHASKQSLEVYQHLGLESVDRAYQEAVKGMESTLNGRGR